MKRSCACTCTSGTWKRSPNVSTTCSRLALAQQAVVDEDARQLVADRLVHEQRSDGGVDAAGERAEHALAADLGADALDLLLDHGRRRPDGRGAGDLVEEVLQHVLSVRRVHDLGMELDAVQLPRAILERGHGRVLGRGDDLTRPRAARSTVSRCDIHAVCSAGSEVKSLPPRDAHVDLAVLARARAVDAAAQLEREQLRAVTDAERRDPELEDRGVHFGAPSA